MIKIENVKANNDIETVVSLAKEIWEEHYIKIISNKQIEYMIDKFQSYGVIKNSINTDSEYYIISLDGIPVGYFCIKAENNRLFLSKFYIIEKARGKGIASKVINFIIKKALTKNLKCIYLTVNRYNVNSLEIYKHFGFNIENSVDTNIENGFFMNDYVMYKYI